MYVNGERIVSDSGISVSELLSKQGYDPQRVAIEINGNIVPRASYDSEKLCEGDKIEIVCFVGGG